MPWIKLSTNVLQDEKIRFLLRKHGHEVITFWVGLLTSNDDGIITTEQEILADVFEMQEEKFIEIKTAFIKYNIISENEDGIVINNWKHYQQSESTERVKKYRERQKEIKTSMKQSNGDDVTKCNGDVTPCNEMKRIDIDIDIDKDKEEESSSVYDSSSLIQQNEKLKKSNTHTFDISTNSNSPPHFEIAYYWYNKLAEKTAKLISPSEIDMKKALELYKRINGDVSRCKNGVDKYFAEWEQIWFAQTKDSRTKKTDKKPEYSFSSFCSNFAELESISNGKKFTFEVGELIGGGKVK